MYHRTVAILKEAQTAWPLATQWLEGLEKWIIDTNINKVTFESGSMTDGVRSTIFYFRWINILTTRAREILNLMHSCILPRRPRTGRTRWRLSTHHESQNSVTASLLGNLNLRLYPLYKRQECTWATRNRFRCPPSTHTHNTSHRPHMLLVRSPIITPWASKHTTRVSMPFIQPFHTRPPHQRRRRARINSRT